MNGTIRDNIVFYSEFDKAKYKMYRLESLYEFSKYTPGSKDSTIRELNQLIRLI